MNLSVIALISLFLVLIDSVQINYKDICGNKLHDSCPNAVNTKIVGGDSSCAEKVPWNVLVEKIDAGQTDGKVHPYCGGSLITSQHVLTAAHCYWTNENLAGVCPEEFLLMSANDCDRSGCPSSCTRLGPEDVRLHLGITRRSEADPSTSMRVQSINIHPRWDKTDKLNDIFAGHDIALLKMEREVPSYSSRVVPICLPDPVRDRYLMNEDTGLDVAGFGIIATRAGSRVFPDVVQTARVSLMDRQDCRSFWPLMNGNQLCAIGSKLVTDPGSKSQIVADSCNGDSGGGLTGTNFNGREVLLGVISFGEPQCGRRGGKPGVYTNVMDHLGWIRSHIEGSTAAGGSCQAGNGKACVFPFKFRNKKFNGCTTEFDDTGEAWCSTRVTAEGEHVSGAGEWGYCNSDCSTNTGVAVVASWSAWSACSVSCGSGQQTRTRDQGQLERRSCRTAVSCGSWSAWSACSVSCGRGSQQRTHSDGRLQTQDCSKVQCPAAATDQEEEVWLIGGDNTRGSVERLVETSGGNVCSRSISSLPNDYTEHVAGYLAGKVMVCGGNSGTNRQTGKYQVHNPCYFAWPSQPASWNPAPSMKANTTNAAYAVHNDDLYVFGGYQKPACGFRAGVQIFRSRSDSWTWSTKYDPPFELGAYQCAVTVGDLIFVIGGWYPHNHYPSAPTCKEELSSRELTQVNQEWDYYQDRVQIFDPVNVKWYQGPTLLTRRRKHGCSLVKMSGNSHGIMVVGGVNSKVTGIRTVEYLDLGSDLSNININQLRWRELAQIPSSRSGNPVIVDGRNYVHVVGGNRQSDDKSIQRFNKRNQAWESLGNTINRRFDFSYVKLPRRTKSC